MRLFLPGVTKQDRTGCRKGPVWPPGNQNKDTLYLDTGFPPTASKLFKCYLAKLATAREYGRKHAEGRLKTISLGL